MQYMVLGLSFELNKSAVKDDFLEQLEKLAYGLNIQRYEILYCSLCLVL